MVEDGLVDFDREILEPQLRTRLRSRTVLRERCMGILHLGINAEMSPDGERSGRDCEFGPILNLNLGTGTAAYLREREGR
jgi:hypothetical protein